MFLFFLLDFFLGVEPFTAREDWGKAPVELILRLVTPDRSRVLAGHCWQEELHILYERHHSDMRKRLLSKFNQFARVRRRSRARLILRRNNNRKLSHLIVRHDSECHSQLFE